MPTCYTLRVDSSPLLEIFAIRDEELRKRKLIDYFDENKSGYKYFCDHDEICRTHKSWSLSVSRTTLDYANLEDKITFAI